MRALLVRPWVNKKVTTVKNFLFGEPLGLECVATLLKALEVEVVVADFMVEEKGSIERYLERYKPDLVGVTSQCTDVEKVLEIADKVKRYDVSIPVWVGGVQATCFPDAFFQKSIDYVFRSTTRANIKEMLEEIQGSRMKARIDGIYSKHLDFKNDGEFCRNEYVVPDRTSTKRYRSEYKYVGYQPCAIIQTAYGCRNRCKFCVRWKLEGKLTEIPIEEIVEQISEIEEPYVMICDNDFLINEKRLIQFCELLEARAIKKQYICYGSVNSILEKKSLFERLSNNGLVAVLIGYEAFDDGQMEAYHKRATIDDNIEATQTLKKYNIASWGSFIIHPDWDKKDFNQLVKYIKRIQPELVTFSPLVPHPLTPLYEEYKDRLLYSIKEYEKWNFGDVIIRPSKLTLKQYYIQVLKLSFRINSSWYAISYVLKAFPLKNIFRIVFGFNTFFSVYIKNIFMRR